MANAVKSILGKKYRKDTRKNIKGRLKMGLKAIKISKEKFKETEFEGDVDLPKKKFNKQLRKERLKFQLKAAAELGDLASKQKKSDKVQKELAKFGKKTLKKANKYTLKAVRKHAPHLPAYIVANDEEAIDSETIKKIFKKDIKKYEKKIEDKDVAQVISLLFPVKEEINNVSFNTRIIVKSLVDAKSAIEFDDIIDAIYKNSKKSMKKKHFKYQLLTSLLKIKGKIWNTKGLDANQKSNQESIRTWFIEQLNKLRKDDIKELITNYVKAREKDDDNSADREHIVNFIEICNTAEYKQVKTVVDKFLSKSETKEKYLK
jgi:hypothetical protein